MFDWLDMVFNPAGYWLKNYGSGADLSSLPEWVQQKIKAENLNIFSAYDQKRIKEILKEYEQIMKGQFQNYSLLTFVIPILFLVVVLNLITKIFKKKGR